MKLRIVDLAIREKLPYREAYDAALTGKFGPVEREGKTMYIIVPDASPASEPAGAA